MDDNDWIGHVPARQLGTYMDSALLLTLGGVPWQVYFQRVLSSRSVRNAQLLSYVAAFGCLLMAIPPMIIGAVARVTGELKWEIGGCCWTGMRMNLSLCVCASVERIFMKLLTPRQAINWQQSKQRRHTGVWVCVKLHLFPPVFRSECVTWFAPILLLRRDLSVQGQL